MAETTFIPNSFQTPNAIIDTLMPLLTDSEFRVLMYMVRHVLGWKKRALQRRANISLSNFENGFSYTDSDDTLHQYAGVGLAKSTIRNALKALKKFRIVKPIGDASNKGQEWELAFMTDDNVDIEALEKRHDEKFQKAKKRTENARAKSPKNNSDIAAQSEGVSAQQIQRGISPTDTEGISPTDTEGISPTDTEGISPTDTEGISPTDTEGISPTVPNETHRKDHSKEKTPSSDGIAIDPPVEKSTYDWPGMLAAVEKTFGVRGRQVKYIANMLLGRATKGEWGEHNLPEPMTPEQVLGFGPWYRKENPGMSMVQEPPKIQSEAMLYLESQSANAQGSHIIHVMDTAKWWRDYRMMKHDFGWDRDDHAV